MNDRIIPFDVALPIDKQIESPWIERVRQQSAEWHVAAAKPARKPRKRRGDST